MNMAAIGFCCIDVYENIGKRYATGNGVDCIVHLARRGVETALVSVIGSDEYGKEMLELCREYKIDTAHLQVREGKTSVYRMALKNGVDRVHVENIPGVMADYTPTQSDLEFVKGFEYVHTDLTGRVLHLLPELYEAGCKIIFDFSMNKEEENLKQILPYVHCAFFSCEKKQPEIKDFLKKAKALGAKYVVATFGEEGSMCYDGEKFCEQGIYKVPVVNTVGAGDSFIAGFSWGLMCGKDVEECLEEGARLSSWVVQGFNPY
ncbi:MAG: fructoselysine 6-kinase [Lachnospiraceae bacterium]|nr:fructoselysine 6-kinase [Lachnospiraceae bacterium]